MSKDCNPNFDSMTDMIIRLKYTALAGDADFQSAVKRVIAGDARQISYSTGWWQGLFSIRSTAKVGNYGLYFCIYYGRWPVDGGPSIDKRLQIFG